MKNQYAGLIGVVDFRIEPNRFGTVVIEKPSYEFLNARCALPIPLEPGTQCIVLESMVNNAVVMPIKHGELTAFDDPVKGKFNLKALGKIIRDRMRRIYPGEQWLDTDDILDDLGEEYRLIRHFLTEDLLDAALKLLEQRGRVQTRQNYREGTTYWFH